MKKKKKTLSKAEAEAAWKQAENFMKAASRAATRSLARLCCVDVSQLDRKHAVSFIDTAEKMIVVG
jgi:hypothetical protein